MRLYTKHYSKFSFVGFMKLLFYFTAKYLEIRYLYVQVFNGLKLTFMTQKFQKFIALSLEYIPIVFSYLQYFPAWKSLKSIWSLYNVYSTNFKNVFIKIVFSLFVELFPKHYWDHSGMPLRGHLLAARKKHEF